MTESNSEAETEALSSDELSTRHVTLLKMPASALAWFGRSLLTVPRSLHLSPPKQSTCGAQIIFVVATHLHPRSIMSQFSPIPCKHKPPSIVTHDGKFHADEALACYMLKKLPEMQDANIIRTRDAKAISDADIVVDVGAEYNADQLKFDHHQRSFTLTMNSLRGGGDEWSDIRLSSAGLIYHHYGERVIAKLLEDLNPSEEQVKTVFKKVYLNFIREIDAIDNGIPIADNPKYEVRTDLSSRVSSLSPQWCEESSPEIMMAGFLRAIQLVGIEFLDVVNYYGRFWWKAKEVVRQAILERESVHPSGQIVNLSAGGVPWREHLFDLEKELNIQGLLKYMLFCDFNGSWRVQAVPISCHSFELRIPLRKEWQGLREKELSEKSGIEGCIFVHSTGFIGGNRTYEGVLKMAASHIE